MMALVIDQQHGHGCPFHGAAAIASRGLAPADRLVLPMPKRMVVQRTVTGAGEPELRLFYGVKEISFDEPSLFAFGETLARQSAFRAGDAVAWGDGYDWTSVQLLLETLLDEGILERDGAARMALNDGGMVSASPLEPASCSRPRTWAECAAITQELTGRAVEPGYLELIVPVFRVAHIAVDADGRQVGEANVFPRALRLDATTTWLKCSYAGTRHMADRPMNVSALKVMRLHWKQMMAALVRIRAAFLRRFPDAQDGWTVGGVERLTALVLAVPTYQVARGDRPVAIGALHPALSSLFRVIDGVRTVMHQMLFIPIGDPTRPPDARVTASDIIDYAERSFSFFSPTGVCGGPRHMVESMLEALLDGREPNGSEAFPFHPDVAAALADVEEAFDYGLYGLQAFATVFSTWPRMTRTYERLSEIAEVAVACGIDTLAPWRERLRAHVDRLRAGTYLAREEWRARREQVYSDMYEQCGRGLRVPRVSPGLDEQIGVAVGDHTTAARRLHDALARAVGTSPAAQPHVEAMRRCLLDFFVQVQGIVRAACGTQAEINRLLHRPGPARPFTAADINVHNLLQDDVDGRRLPYLFDELETALGIAVAIDSERIEVIDRAVAG